MRSNRIWNRVAGFMQQLRCESLSQKNMVQMPEQQRIKKEANLNAANAAMPPWQASARSYKSKADRN